MCTIFVCLRKKQLKICGVVEKLAQPKRQSVSCTELAIEYD